MITKNNFKEVLQKLGFSEEKNIFTRDFGEFELKADFVNSMLIYPEAKGLKINERQTCNFSSNENFVVFECVCRLLEKGYFPKHIELEPKWKLGHGASGGRADIWIKDNDENSLLIIECKTAGKEFEDAWKDTCEDGGQLFSYFQQEKSTQFVALYASDFVDDKIKFEYKLIAVRDNEEYLKSFGKKEVLSFKNADTVKKTYKVWDETYKKNFSTKGIFEQDIAAYSIGKDKYSIADLDQFFGNLFENSLSYVVKQTNEFILSKPKTMRKSFGQFFTSVATARFMAKMLTVPSKSTIKILDPGAGTGILSAALIEFINIQHTHIKEIELTCYETNLDVFSLLERNIEHVKNCSKLKITAKIIKDSYILSQSHDFSETLMASFIQPKYDLIIANPPYFKLAKFSPEAISMSNICHGTPNIYFIFAAMSLFNLCENGEMVYILPCSWTSGAYFSYFRRYLLENGKVTDIHVFTSRKKVFDKEDVLQETMILKVKKTNITPHVVNITSSKDSDCFNDIAKISVPYNIVVSGHEQYVHLVKSQDEVDVLNKVNAFEKSLPSMGMKMKTGITVDFRNRNLLRNISGEHSVPLFYSQHIKDGNVVFPIGKENEYISDELSSVVQSNRNYLFVKRFTTKEERRRLQCAVYIADRYPKYKKISTQNKINFIDTIDGSWMSEDLVYGLYAVLNSTLYDKYYRVLNGSTQVNATEMNSIPMPDLNALKYLGQKLIKCGEHTTEHCDKILEEVINA